MFGLYKKKDVVKIPDPPKVGLFHIAFKRANQPTPGVMDMAYKSLALPAEPILGPGTYYNEPIRATARPVVAVKAVPTQGLATVSGGIRLNPLFDPESGGYPAGFSGIDNMPYRRAEIAPIGYQP